MTELHFRSSAPGKVSEMKMNRRIEKQVLLALVLFAALWQSNLPSQTFSTLHSFTGNDGAAPAAGLVLSGSTLYGTTVSGGVAGLGTVFKVNTDGTGFTTLYSFSGSDGDYPNGLRLSGTTLYGTTSQGGLGFIFEQDAGGSGTVFKINTDGTAFATLHRFALASAPWPPDSTNSDGAHPFSGLVLSGSALYGTTSSGGVPGYGTVFKVNTDGTGFTTLHSFGGAGDGIFPYGGLVVSGSTLYGTTEQGGLGNGTVFKVNTDGTGFTTLNNFSGSDGRWPTGGLMLSAKTLYGTTEQGGSINHGTVFGLTLSGSSISNLSVTWVWPHSITYGVALGPTQLDATANYPGAFAYSPPAGTVLNAGTNILSAVFTPTDTAAYPVAINVQVDVLKAPLTVTAGNASRQYGQNNPVLTGTVTGVVNGDNITANYTCGATPSSPPATYPIVPSLVDPNNRLSNYNVTINDGILTVLTLFPTVEYEIQADFDGRDWLVIQGETVRWQHFDFTPVGLHNPNYPATVISSSANGVSLVNGASWIPSWPNGTGSGAWSSTYEALIPALPPSPKWVSLNVVTGRGTVSIVQLPSAENTDTLIVEFNDGAFSSDALYDVQIYVATTAQPMLSAQRNGRLALTWSTAPGQAYQVQYKDDLSQPAWLNLGNPITAANVTASSSDAITNRARFYRVTLYP